MAPEVYFRMAFILISRGLIVDAFSVPFFILENKEIVINIVTQIGAYGFASLNNRPFHPDNALPPLIKYGPETWDFLTQVEGVTRAERVATLAFLLSGTGLLSKTADVVTNAAAGAFIYVLFEYIAALAKSSGGGPIPFVYLRLDRTFQNKFTKKQHRQCQLAIAGIFILIIPTCHFIGFIFTKVGEYLQLKVYRIKFGLKKFYRTKIKVFRSKPKVQFIPLK